MMTSNQYAKGKGEVCPNCGSIEVQGDGAVRRLSHVASQHCVCRKCGANWNDVFELAGYSRLVVDGIVVYQSSQEA